MGIVSNIIDALRRIGRPTERSAIARQDRQLEGKEVLERHREIIRGAEGDTPVFIATTKPLPETVHILTDEEVRPLRENVAYGVKFLETFDAYNDKDWTLDHLDAAFASWLNARDRRGYSEEAVMELLGAMFGHYCNSQLNMHWIKLSDADGSTLAVDGVLKVFRAFPYQMISKRIADSEYGFFKPVFSLIKHNEAQASPRSGLVPQRQSAQPIARPPPLHRACSPVGPRPILASPNVRTSGIDPR